MLGPSLMADDPEVVELLQACVALLEALRRMTDLSERVLQRAVLTQAESDDARQEIATTRAGIEQLDAMLTLRRQKFRAM